MLTNVSKELLKVVFENTDTSLARDITKTIQEKARGKCIVKLHKINYFYPDGNNFSYNLKDMMEETN